MALTKEDLQMIGQLLDTKIQPIKDDIQEMKTDIQDLKADMEGLKADVNDMRLELGDVKFRVMKLEVLVENEIRTNIKRVAEGHLDLSRKLNECIKLSNDVKDKQEIQDVYLNMHQSKLMAM